MKFIMSFLDIFNKIQKNSYLNNQEYQDSILSIDLLG